MLFVVFYDELDCLNIKFCFVVGFFYNKKKIRLNYIFNILKKNLNVIM